MFLIDEIDCADEKFEAFLLEFLSNFQVCILQVCILQVCILQVCILQVCILG